MGGGELPPPPPPLPLPEDGVAVASAGSGVGVGVSVLKGWTGSHNAWPILRIVPVRQFTAWMRSGVVPVRVARVESVSLG